VTDIAVTARIEGPGIEEWLRGFFVGPGDPRGSIELWLRERVHGVALTSASMGGGIMGEACISLVFAYPAVYASDAPLRALQAASFALARVFDDSMLNRDKVELAVSAARTREPA
jgi:hypothetical protein